MALLIIALTIACVVALTTGNGLPGGVDYSQYDPQKLQERYNIIQALVRPRAAYRPKIGSAYAQKGYNNKINYGYQPASYVKQPAYAPVKQSPVYAPVKNTAYAPVAQSPVYAPVKNTAYAPVAQSPVYAPVKNTGYAIGYANPTPKAAAPINYGFQSYGGIRFGGGQVHPVFNNDLLYKNKGLGPYDTTDPIFLGGGPTKAAPAGQLKSSQFRAQTPYNAYNKQSSPLIDAYNDRPSGYNAYPYYG